MDELLNEPYRYLRLALPIMTKLNVPVTPENYMVWYRYVSGRDTSLSRAIDAMVTDGVVFSPERNEELYRRFCGKEGEEDLMEEIRSSLKRILGTVANELSVLAGQAAEYESFVSSTVDRLSDSPTAADIREAAEGIITATKTLGDRGRTLRLQLDETTESFDVLRKQFVQARKESLVDFLTGIPNRRYFDGTLTAMVHGVADGGWSILLLDIDHFKDFNDRFGHLTGDRVLQLVAKTIQKNIKGKDIACRFGGEEFVVILPETLLDGALSVAENIRKSFSKKSLRAVADRRDLGVLTVSIGAACFRPGESVESLLQRADGALYDAKNGGRNRVASAV